MEMLMLKIFA